MLFAAKLGLFKADTLPLLAMLLQLSLIGNCLSLGQISSILVKSKLLCRCKELCAEARIESLALTEGRLSGWIAIEITTLGSQSWAWL
jgi:hypothetical protein